MNTIIKLAPGNIGWFDPITSIHLTLVKTEALVKPGMNTTNIKKALSEGKIIIKQGILETSRQLNPEPVTKIKTVEEKVQTTREIKSEPKAITNKSKSKSKKTKTKKKEA